MQFTVELDTSGLLCPVPIIKAKRALAAMAGGQVLRVVSTDPGAARDMLALTAKTGDTLLEQTSENKKFIFYLRKA
jgi:tRNA 2-thiouridine synthesizing protein A